MSLSAAARELRHDHVFLSKQHDNNARRTLWVVALTVLMMVAEIIAGWRYGSMALLADGFHMATHAGALGITAAAYAYARRHARDERYSFGTGKVGDLSAFASALILGLVAIGIAAESIGRLFQSTPIAFTEATVVAAIGLVVNLVSAMLLAQRSGPEGEAGHHHHGHGDHGHTHDHHGGHAHDNNLRAAYLHVLADALTSVLAIVALLVGRFYGWVWLDPAMGVVGALLIAHWSMVLLRDSAGVLLDTADATLKRKVATALADSDVEVTDLHIWKIGPGSHAAIISFVGDADTRSVRARLAGLPGIDHLTVERR